MKHFIAIASFLLSSTASGQNWDEWMRQKRTQIRYLVNQVTALQVYIDLGKEGYAIYKDGLELIGDIKEGQFNLHKDYFASLSDVNPRISHSPAVREVLAWHRQIVQFKERVHSMELGAEQASIRKLFTQLVISGKEYVGQITLLVTDDNYQLKDEERIRQIHRVHTEMQALYAFARSICGEALLLKRQQAAASKNIDVLQRFHGLNSGK